MSRLSLQREYAATHLLPHNSPPPPRSPSPTPTPRQQRLASIIPDYPSTPAYPLSWVPAYHTRQLYTHLLLAPSSLSSSPHLPRPRLASLAMQPYTLRPSSLRRSGSYTEAIGNVETVPPPSPSPRTRKSLPQKSRGVAMRSEWGASLPVMQKPRHSMSGGKASSSLVKKAIARSIDMTGPERGDFTGQSKGNRDDGITNARVPLIASSMPVHRPGAVPIQGILHAKPTRRSASKIPTVYQAQTTEQTKSTDQIMSVQAGVLSGSLRSLSIGQTPAPVPLISPDVMGPFLPVGSAIRPIRRLHGGSTAFSSGAVSRERRVLRDLTNHAGLG